MILHQDRVPTDDSIVVLRGILQFWLPPCMQRVLDERVEANSLPCIIYDVYIFGTSEGAYVHIYERLEEVHPFVVRTRRVFATFRGKEEISWEYIQVTFSSVSPWPSASQQLLQRLGSLAF